MLIGVGLVLSILLYSLNIWIDWGSGLSVFIDIIFLLFTTWLIFLYFFKKKIFPKYFIIWLVINALLEITGYVLLDNANDVIRQDVASVTGRSIFVAIIWIPYMIKSKRVKATFIK